jgi:LacI family transcriptional regulator
MAGSQSPGAGERRRVRLRDVAAAAGVSVTQASAALAGYPDVSKSTRARVRSVAASLGYQPSEHARLLRARANTPTHCAIVMLGTSPVGVEPSAFFGAILSGILMRTASANIDVRISTNQDSDVGAADFFANLVAADTAAAYIVITPLDLKPRDVEPFEQSRIPFVLVNRHFARRPVPNVGADFAAASRTAATEFGQAGHRRMALLVQDRQTSVIRDYRAGWESGLRPFGIAAEHAPLIPVDETDTAGREKFYRSLLTDGLPAGGGRPTAITCVNEHPAHHILQIATQLGLRVPDDLSLITCEDNVSPYTTPPLCSFDLGLHDIGIAAVDKLIDQIEGRGAGQPRLIEPKLVHRSSCGPAPGPR